MVLLEVKNLKTYFKRNQGLLSRVLHEPVKVIRAVDGVSLDVNKGEIVGIVGETGCGKTTLGRSLLLLVRPEAGEIVFEDKNILKLRSEEVRVFRRQAQMIFQDAVRSLDPKMKVRDAIAEPLRTYGLVRSEKEIDERIEFLLEQANLDPEYKEKYPFQLSGGEARRVTIARSLALYPKLIICDEPTSGLDVSISSKILNTMSDIHDKLGLSYIWISHNLHVVRYVSAKILIMYLGKVVEEGETFAVFHNPLHPYTQALFSALPSFIENFSSIKRRIILKGEVPSPINPPVNCRFYERCLRRMSICMESEPKLDKVEKNHRVACWLYSNT